MEPLNGRVRLLGHSAAVALPGLAAGRVPLGMCCNAGRHGILRSQVISVSLIRDSSLAGSSSPK